MARRWMPRSFSLRLLFLVMLSSACAFAWYGNRLRAIQRERERLAGAWRLVTINGSTYSPADVKLVFGGADGTIVYPPRSGVGRIDFLVPDGKGGKKASRAIYKFESDGTILFAQNGEEKPRPTNFNKVQCDSLFVVQETTKRTGR